MNIHDNHTYSKYMYLDKRFSKIGPNPQGQINYCFPILGKFLMRHTEFTEVRHMPGMGGCCMKGNNKNIVSFFIILFHFFFFSHYYFFFFLSL